MSASSDCIRATCRSVNLRVVRLAYERIWRALASCPEAASTSSAPKPVRRTMINAAPISAAVTISTVRPATISLRIRVKCGSRVSATMAFRNFGVKSGASFFRRCACSWPSMFNRARGPMTGLHSSDDPPGPTLEKWRPSSRTSRMICASDTTTPTPGTRTTGPAAAISFSAAYPARWPRNTTRWSSLVAVLAVIGCPLHSVGSSGRRTRATTLRHPTPGRGGQRRTPPCPGGRSICR